MKHPQKSQRKEGSPVGLNPTILDEFFSASRTARRHGAGKQGLSDSWLATDQSRATPRQTPLDPWVDLKTQANAAKTAKPRNSLLQ